MLPPHIKNRFLPDTSKAVVMRPIHLRLSEDIIKHLEKTADEHGFKGIQSLIRLYIRQGLDRDNCDYQLANDLIFIEKLKRKGVSAKIIEEALLDTSNVCDTQKSLWYKIWQKIGIVLPIFLFFITKLSVLNVCNYIYKIEMF